MNSGWLSAIGAAAGWLAFPLIPALLGVTCSRLFSPWSFPKGPDPSAWGWDQWLLQLGPLLGYGFLAGATLGLVDDPGRPRWRRWAFGRPACVAVAPWMGMILGVGLYLLLNQLPPSAWERWVPAGWQDSTARRVAGWVVVWAAVGVVAYGWTLPAWRVLRRARVLGRARSSITTGLAMAFGFVGSLFGSFWAILSAWRGYFFDPTLLPLLVAAGSLSLVSGCGGPVTRGDVRRQELFQALLVSWLIGLALAWRWWGRPPARKSTPSDLQLLDPAPEQGHAPEHGREVGLVVEPPADPGGVR